jgi:hypothetical protein
MQKERYGLLNCLREHLRITQVYRSLSDGLFAFGRRSDGE